MCDLPTPHELAMQVLGEVPENTPETWEELCAKLEYATGNKHDPFVKPNAYGNALMDAVYIKRAKQWELEKEKQSF